METLTTHPGELFFPSDSPINTEKLTGQNRRLYEYLKAGKTINCLDPAMNDLKIGYLNSRISDLKKRGVMIYKRVITVYNTTVKEYSLAEFKD